MKEASTKYIIGLDVARILCAAIVVLFHLTYALWDGTSPFQPKSVVGHMAMEVISAGWIGVQIFFIISGFVIAYSAKEAGAITFLRHRAVRLVPGMMICATFEAVILLASHTMSLNHVIGAWSRSVGFRLNPPYIDYSHWTLPIEVLFYALVFLVLAFSQRRHLSTLITLLGSLSALYCGLLGLAAHGRWQSKAHAALMGIGNVVGTNDVVIVRYGMYFALGAALYALFIEKRWTLGAFCIPAFLIASYFEIADRNVQFGHNGVLGGSLATPYVCFVIAFFFVALAIRFNEKLIRLAGPKTKLVCRRLGLVTYPLYLIHQTTGLVLIRETHAWLGDRLAILLAVPVVSALALAVSFWLEPPFGRWLKRALEREPQIV